MRTHQPRSYGRCVPTDDPTTHPANDVPAAAGPCASQYEIRVSGHFGPRWEAWFDGLDVTTEEDGTTVISGVVADQSALHGLLAKLRDLGIPLISLLECPHEATPDLPRLSNPRSPHNPSGATP